MNYLEPRIDALFEESLSWLDSVFERMSSNQHLGPPVWVMTPGGPGWRHNQKHDLLLVFLKGTFTVRLLGAGLLLLRAGHFQEVGIMCRCLDEACEDIEFFLMPFGKDGVPSKEQERALNAFFQEEYVDDVGGLPTTVKRDMVDREKIRAALFSRKENPLNPSDSVHMGKSISRVFSGFVHGAYPQIMETYGGNPPKFNLRGMKGTPLELSWQRMFANYFFRAIVMTKGIARRLEFEEIANEAEAWFGRFAKEIPGISPDDGIKLLKEMKAKSRKRSSGE